MSGIQGNFSIAPGASVEVLCSTDRNTLQLHTATGPPLIGVGARLAMEQCDVNSFASPAAALNVTAAAIDLFGNEANAVVRLTACTVLQNWNVRCHSFIVDVSTHDRLFHPLLHSSRPRFSGRTIAETLHSKSCCFAGATSATCTQRS